MVKVWNDWIIPVSEVIILIVIGVVYSWWISFVIFFILQAFELFKLYSFWFLKKTKVDTNHYYEEDEL